MDINSLGDLNKNSYCKFFKNYKKTHQKFGAVGQQTRATRLGFWKSQVSRRPAIFNPSHLMAYINCLLKFWGTPQHKFSADLTKNGCNLDSFTLDGSCCVGWCHFLIWQFKGGRQRPWLNRQVLHVLEILAAHWLK